MESVTLKVSSAFLVGGRLCRRGELVTVGIAAAKDLLSRGKAELATDESMPMEPPAPVEADPVEESASQSEDSPADKPKRKRGK